MGPCRGSSDHELFGTTFEEQFIDNFVLYAYEGRLPSEVNLVVARARDFEPDNRIGPVSEAMSSECNSNHVFPLAELLKPFSRALSRSLNTAQFTRWLPILASPSTQTPVDDSIVGPKVQHKR